MLNKSLFLFFELGLFQIVILLKTAYRNHHIFLWNKTEVNKRSFKMQWIDLNLVQHTIITEKIESL
jgi:hypothetical protein